jgi:molecular chaperone GrpE
LTPWTSEPVPPAAAPPKEAAAAEPVPAERPAELKKIVQERDEYLDLLQRTRADYLNYIKRSQKERADSIKYGIQEFAAKVVTVMDDFARAIASAETTQDSEKFFEGVKLIEAQFQKVLADAGITPIETVGKPFDPSRHEAIMQEENATVPDGTILEEFQRGFMLNDRVLRAARVKVARRPAAPADKKEEGEDRKEAISEPRPAERHGAPPGQ